MSKLKFIITELSLYLNFNLKIHIQTWVESKTARIKSYIFFEIPSVGPAITKIYVTPSKGIKTKSAFAAFLYCWVSTFVAERSFVIRTYNK